MQNWFPTLAYGPVVTALAVNGACGVIAWLLVFRGKFLDDLKSRPVVPPFMNVSGGIFALLIAFMASSAWQSAESAHVSLQQEHMALEWLHVMTAGVDGLGEVRRQLIPPDHDV